jgi:hypothetical protein
MKGFIGCRRKAVCRVFGNGCVQVVESAADALPVLTPALTTAAVAAAPLAPVQAQAARTQLEVHVGSAVRSRAPCLWNICGDCGGSLRGGAMVMTCCGLGVCHVCAVTTAPCGTCGAAVRRAVICMALTRGVGAVNRAIAQLCGVSGGHVEDVRDVPRLEDGEVELAAPAAPAAPAADAHALESQAVAPVTGEEAVAQDVLYSPKSVAPDEEQVCRVSLQNVCLLQNVRLLQDVSRKCFFSFFCCPW